ncbi:MAG: DUF3800 domain-containing protein [Acidobacteriaceae bacterium]
MYLCYIDESGTSDIPGNTSHFILAGVSIPIWYWRMADADIETVLKRYDLSNEEVHTAWLLRKYLEQSRIDNFETMSRHARRSAVERERNIILLALQKSGQHKLYKQTKKNHRHTQAYIHLTLQERTKLVHEIADTVAGWGYCRLFAECIDKLHFDPSRNQRNIDQQAFEQVVSRFERYLTNINNSESQNYGLLVHDNNETVARKHTQLMRRFHAQGTLWTRVERIIEAPLFVDSKLTRMVQVADLCSYALRRYLENSETELFQKLFVRADRVGNTVVGMRHFTGPTCACEICKTHRTNTR